MNRFRLTIVALVVIMTAGAGDATDFDDADLWSWPDEAFNIGDASLGKWSAPVPVKSVPGNVDISPVHAALVPFVKTAPADTVGKIVAYRGSQWMIYDLSDPLATTTMDYDSTNTHRPFCNGTNFTKDGKLVVIGGSYWTEDGTNPGDGCTVNTVGWTSIFDPQSDTFVAETPCPFGIENTPHPDNYSRYYATATTLPDGKILLTAGDSWMKDSLDVCFDEGIEPVWSQSQWAIYDPSVDNWYPLGDQSNSMLAWRNFPGTGSWDSTDAIPYFPHMKVLPAGIFWEGYDNTNTSSVLWRWDGQFNQIVTPHINGFRNESSCVIMTLDPSDPDAHQTILLIGGGPQAAIQTSAEWISYRRDGVGGWESTETTWTETDALAGKVDGEQGGRRRPDAVMLPTGDVFLLGGEHKYVSGEPVANRRCEILDADTMVPGAGTWAEVDSLENARMYHSSALLLPDGRIFATGNEDSVALGASYEIFYPPYLFDTATTFADRPEITGGLHELHYGLNATIEVTHAGVADPAAEIADVCIVKLGTSTHGTNMSQRRVKLNFVDHPGDTKTIIIQGPPDSTWAPPGDYMLCVVDSAGVPSIADFVNVNADGAYIVQSGETAIWGGECRLSRDFKVEEGGTLEILPGTVVSVETVDNWNQGLYADDVEILVAGQLFARGTQSERITFTSAATSPNSEDWHGIRFLDAADSLVSDLEYCDLEYPTHAATLDSLSGNIFDCRFTETTRDIYVPQDTRLELGHEWNLVGPTDVVVASIDSLETGEDTTRVEIVISGTLRTSGAGSDSVRFISTDLDAVNGDDWYGLTVWGNGWPDGQTNAIVDRAVFAHAAFPLSVWWADTVLVTNSHIRSYEKDGFTDWGSDATIEDCLVERALALNANGFNGIRVQGSFATIRRVRVNTQKSNAIWIQGTKFGCLSVAPQTPGTVLIDDVTLIGPGSASTTFPGSNGVNLKWACHENNVTVQNSNIQKWPGAGIRMFNTSDVAVTCNCIMDNADGVWHKRQLLDIDADNGQGKLWRNNFEENVKNSINALAGPSGDTTTAGFLTGAQGVSSTGQNRFVRMDSPNAKSYRHFGSFQAARTDSAHSCLWRDHDGTIVSSPASDSVHVKLRDDNFHAVEDTGANPASADTSCSVDANCTVSAIALAESGPADAALRSGGDGGASTGSSALGDLVPERFGLSRAVPNPTGGSASVELSVPLDAVGVGTVVVYDVSGRAVRSLHHGPLAPGRYVFLWDLVDSNGRAVSPAVYFLRAAVGGYTQTRKLTVLR